MKKSEKWVHDFFDLSDRQYEIIKSDKELLNILYQKYQKLTEEKNELLAQLAFYKASANAMPNPIFIKNGQLEFEFFNSKYLEFFGENANSFLGKRVTDLDYLSQEDREKFQTEDNEMIKNQSTIQYEQSFNRDNQLVETMYWSKGFLVPETGEKGLIGEIVDISEQKRMQRELSRNTAVLEQLMKEAEKTSKIDPATRVYNRQILTKDLPATLKKACEHGIPVCGMLSDIDDFKYINDNYGHPKGDEVLLKFTDIMRYTLRDNDIIMRYGGDEFAAILLGVSLETAREIAERFHDKVANNIILPNGKPVTISVGVTEYKCGEDIMSFLTRMDEGMYKSKKSGKNQVSTF